MKNESGEGCAGSHFSVSVARQGSGNVVVKYFRTDGSTKQTKPVIIVVNNQPTQFIICFNPYYQTNLPFLLLVN